MVTADTPLLAVEDGEIATVELARPDSLNALNPEMIDGLLAVFEALAADPPRGVLLTGRGRVTCAGMDRNIVAGGDYSTEYADLDETLGQVYVAVADLPAPVAMAGKGALVGAGAILSLCAEFLVLDGEATYSFPEVQYRIASERIARLVPAMAGRRVGAELALTGEPVEPDRAYDLGLANDVVPADAVEDRARELLAAVADNDRETVETLLDMLGDVD